MRVLDGAIDPEDVRVDVAECQGVVAGVGELDDVGEFDGVGEFEGVGEFDSETDGVAEVLQVDVGDTVIGSS